MTKRKSTKASRKKIVATIEYGPDCNRTDIHFDKDIIPNRPVTVFSEHYRDGSYRAEIQAWTSSRDVDMIRKLSEVDGKIWWLHISARRVTITKHEDQTWGKMPRDVACKVAEYLNADIEFKPELQSTIRRHY